MKQLQRTLARSARDLDAAAQELYNRSFGEDWDLIERAIGPVVQVCNGFLDEAALKEIPTAGACPRACPDNVVSIKATSKKVAKRKRAA
jgi:hypothetical protein